MKYAINIKDGDTGAYLGNASLRVQGPGGYGDAMLPNLAAGEFSLDMSGSEFAGLSPADITLTASAPGYGSISVSGAQLQPENDFLLAKNNFVKPLLVGAGLVAAFALMNRKKKVSGFKDLPQAAQTALVIGGVGLVAYFAIFGNKNSGQRLVDKAAGDLSDLANAGIHPTFTTTQAEAYAGSLRTAFDDCGTDEGTVFSVLNAVTNNADIALLVSTYGTRGYKGCFDGDYFSQHNYNLAEAISSELSSGAIAAINNSFASRGINFKF